MEAIVPKTLDLLLPDWKAMDDQLRSREPFALWYVGDLHVIYHWLDYALNQGYSKVRIWCADRPDMVRKAMQDATLWPLEWEVNPISKDAEAPVAAYNAARLPWAPDDLAEPTDGWSLLDYWFALERHWFAFAYQREDLADLNLAFGRFCSIHPSVKIHMPVWIGHNVYIGEGSEIGPNASIGHGSVLAGENILRDAKISKHTFLGAKTELDRCYLDGGLLLNLKYHGRVPKIDQFIADTWKTSTQKPGWTERALALVLWLGLKLRSVFSRARGEREVIETIQGRKLATYANAPIWRQRIPWLMEVVKGRYFLFGVLPREREQLTSLDAEWQEILSDAPVGVFSYADTHGCHSPDDEMEALHAVYQAAQPRENLRDVCRRWVWQAIIKGGLWTRSASKAAS